MKKPRTLPMNDKPKTALQTLQYMTAEKSTTWTLENFASRDSWLSEIAFSATLPATRKFFNPVTLHLPSMKLEKPACQRIFQ